MTYTTSAIVIKNSPFREYDKLVTLYTLDHGKITALARGTLKIKSKLCGHLEPCVHTNVMIAHGRYFDVLAQSTAHEVFPKVRQSFLKTITASVALEAVDELTKHGMEDRAVFDHIASFLCFLEHAEHDDQSMFSMEALKFVFRLIYLLGHGPDIEKCVRCKHQVTIEELSAFDYEHSVLVCHNCYDGNKDGKEIVSGVELRALQCWKDPDFAASPLATRLMTSLQRLVHTLVRHLTDGRGLNSLAFLERYCTIKP